MVYKAMYLKTYSLILTIVAVIQRKEDGTSEIINTIREGVSFGVSLASLSSDVSLSWRCLGRGGPPGGIHTTPSIVS